MAAILGRVVTVVQAIAVVCVGLFVVLLFANEPDDGDEPAAPAAALSGEEIYADRCAGCHGADGDGGSGPRLAGGRVVERYPDVADQIEVVTEGRGGMPAFGERLTADEIEAVVEYTRGL